MKTCEQYQEDVSAYVDGELGDKEMSELFFHLGTCGKCRTFMTSVIRLGSFLQSNEPARRRVKTTMPAEQSQGRAQRHPIWKRTFDVSYPVAAAAAALMLISGSLFFIPKAQPATVVNKTQIAYVYIPSLPAVDVVASPLPVEKTN